MQKNVQGGMILTKETFKSAQESLRDGGSICTLMVQIREIFHMYPFCINDAIFLPAEDQLFLEEKCLPFRDSTRKR
jgi:hypothetical protein